MRIGHGLLALLFFGLADSQIVSKETVAAQSDEKIYSPERLDLKPEFHGGLEAFQSYIIKNANLSVVTKRPAKAYVSFIVEKDGSLSAVKLIPERGPDIGSEFHRVLHSSPKWKPGVQSNQTVRVMMILPIPNTTPEKEGKLQKQ